MTVGRIFLPTSELCVRQPDGEICCSGFCMDHGREKVLHVL